MRQGRLGDAGAFKAVALTADPYPEALEAVRRLDNPFPNFAQLLSLPTPEGSLGQAFAAFVARHGITPLAISDETLKQLAPLNMVATRYVLVHDVFHVLLDFDISRPGELAVWTFVATQQYSPTYARAATVARLFYPLLEPSALAELGRQRDRAFAMGRQVPCLIGQPLEAYWSLALTEARQRLGIRGVG